MELGDIQWRRMLRRASRNCLSERIYCLSILLFSHLNMRQDLQREVIVWIELQRLGRLSQRFILMPFLQEYVGVKGSGKRTVRIDGYSLFPKSKICSPLQVSPDRQSCKQKHYCRSNDNGLA